jgi:hypothetical protein
MKVKAFMMTAGHNHEREILRNMHDGIASDLIPSSKRELRYIRAVNKANGRGTGVEYEYGEKYSKCDVGVMFGSWKPQRSNIHHVCRSSIVEKSNCFICIETPLLNRRVLKPNTHQRVGINGFLNRDAIWGPDIDHKGDRLDKLGIHYKGWKNKSEGPIVIAMQLGGDASLRNNDINQWVKDTVSTLRANTDRPIEIRTHPAVSEKGWSDHDELFRHFMFNNYKDISFTNGKAHPWENQLQNAYCVVAYTSGLSIDAALQGIPVIACDEGNFAWNIGERKLANVENMQLATEPQVQQWLNNLAYCQWTPEEMESGECWAHLKESVNEILNSSQDDND